MQTIKRLLSCVCACTVIFTAACSLTPPNPQSSQNSLSFESAQSSQGSENSESSESSESVSAPEPPEEDELSFIVDENNYTTLGETFVSASELTAFRGDYEGNAAKLTYTQDGDGVYRFLSPFSDIRLAEMQDTYGYTHVSVWFAVNGISSGAMPIVASEGLPYSIMEAAGYTEYPLMAADNRQWYNVSVPIALYKKTVSYALDGSGKQYAHLMTVNGEETAGDISFYVGNVEIVREASVLTLNEFTAKGVWNRDVSSVYVSAEDEELMNFTGGYVGGAKRFKASANVNWRVDNYFTLPQLRALKAYYTHVTLWFAFDNLATGHIHLENWNTDKMPKFNEYSTVNGGDKTFVPEDNGVWYSMTVAIDDFITICTAEDGQTARDCFYLFRIVNRAEAIEGTLMQFYLGDIFFENMKK